MGDCWVAVNVRGMALCLVAALFALVADGSALAAEKAGTSAAGKPINIVCTTEMIADVVRQVAGERAEVTALIGSGVDPHLYQATRSDVARLLEADIIFYNGLLLEGKMTDALIRVARRKPVHAVSELVEESALLAAADSPDHHDPHLWMDVGLWKRCTEKVAEALAEFDPAGAEEYRSNFQAYAARLDALDAYARKVIGTVPEQSRVLVTAHDAFGYFGRAYGMEVRGIQGISTESEAGIDDINRLVDLLVNRKVRAVFVETSVSDKNVRSLLEGAGSRGHEVAIGGRLFSDAMGRPGSYEGTYVGMIDHNATTIARALSGEAPERGMSGKLSGAE